MRLSSQSKEILLRLSPDDLNVLMLNFTVDLRNCVEMACPYHGCQVYVNKNSREMMINIFGSSNEFHAMRETKWLYQISFGQWIRFFSDVFGLNVSFKKSNILDMTMLEFLTKTHVCLCNVFLFKEVVQVMDWEKTSREIFGNNHTNTYMYSIYEYVRDLNRFSRRDVRMNCTSSFGHFFKMMVTSPSMHDLRGKNDLWFMFKNRGCYSMETNVLDFKPLITAFEIKCNRNNIRVDMFATGDKKLRVRMCHGEVATFSKQNLRVWNKANFRRYRPGIQKRIYALCAYMKMIKVREIKDMIIQAYLIRMYYGTFLHQIKDYFYHDLCDDCRTRSNITDKCAQSALVKLRERIHKTE